MQGSTISIDNSILKLTNYVSRGLADDTSNMKNDKVYLYHGTIDYTVTEGTYGHFNDKFLNLPVYLNSKGVVKRNEDFYKKFLSDSQIKKVYSYASSHGFVGLNSNNYWDKLFNLI